MNPCYGTSRSQMRMQPRGFTMLSRLLAVMTFAATLFAVTHANAQPWGFFGQPDDARLGGRSLGGSSPIARTLVSYPGQHRPGTIVINTAERRLYLITANGQALRYGIGVGRDGFRWSGIK